MRNIKIAFLLFALLFSHACLGFTGSFNAFNAGELSPYLTGRTDIAKYYSGCQTIENFLVLSYGGVVKRPGTKYIANAKSASSKARLVPFEFSTTQAYILEFGNLYIRIYKNGGQVLDGASPVEVVTPYLTADLFELQFSQSADTLYIVHPEYSPRTLTRSSHTSWTLSEITFENGPFLDENITDTTITSTAKSGSVTLTTTGAIWNANHVGALWQLTHVVDANSASGSFTSVDQSSTVDVQLGRKFDFSTHGTWTGTISLQNSYDDGTNWNDVITRHYENDGNIQYSDSENNDNSIYRLSMSEYSSGTLKYNVTARTHKLDGVVRITAFTDANTVVAMVINELGEPNATAVWAEGAWSTDEGFPTCVAFYEERLVLAATANRPQTVWMSKTGDWTDFHLGTNDDESVSYTIAADQVNAIRWISSQTALLIGTTGGEWKMSASNFGEAITPSSVNIRRQSSYGSAYLQPAMVGNVVLFPQRQGRKIRELTYDFATDAWVSPDMTVLSEHILESGLSQMALQQAPDPVLWCVRNDGELALFSYNREQDVLAWSRIVFEGGEVESVAVIPGDGEDEVWISIKRTVNGSVVRYIEQFQPRDWGTDQRDAWFVDSGLGYDGGDAVTITNITQANPCVVTAANAFNDGDHVRIENVTGMVEINGYVYTVNNPTSSSFSLRGVDDLIDIDSTGFSSYVSSGEAEAQEDVFSGLSHLEGETVYAVGDGYFLGEYTVSSSSVDLGEFFNTVRIGKSFVSKLLPHKFDIAGENTESRTKRITHVTARLFKTSNLDIGSSWDSYNSVEFRDSSDEDLGVIPLLTGDRRIQFSGSFNRIAEIYLQSRLPLPCTILAIFPTLEIGN